MTIETCKKRLEIAETDEEKTFWQERLDRKMAKKGLTPKPGVKASGKRRNKTA